MSDGDREGTQETITPANPKRNEVAASLDIIVGFFVAFALTVFEILSALHIGHACHRASQIGTILVVYAPALAWLLILIVPIVRGQTLWQMILGITATSHGSLARLAVVKSLAFWLPIYVAGLAMAYILFCLTPLIAILLVGTTTIGVLLLILTSPLGERIGFLPIHRPLIYRRSRRNLPVIVIQLLSAVVLTPLLTSIGQNALQICPPTFYVLSIAVQQHADRVVIVDVSVTAVLDGQTGKLLRAYATPPHASASSIDDSTIKDPAIGYTFESSYEGGVTIRETKTGRVLRSLPDLYGTSDLVLDKASGHVFAAGEFGLWMLDARTGNTLTSLSPDDVVRLLGHPIPTGTQEP